MHPIADSGSPAKNTLYMQAEKERLWKEENRKTALSYMTMKQYTHAVQSQYSIPAVYVL